MEKLFFLVRQQLNKLENTTITSTGWSLGTGSSASFMTSRHYIRTFLEYVKVYVCRYVNEMNAEQFIPQLYCHLHVLLLHLGRLTELPSSVLNQCSARQGNTSTNTSYHIFHCHLDVHWGVLEILHLITTKYPNAGISSSGQRWCQGPGVEDYSVDPSDPFQQCLQLLLWDLVVLAMKKHGKLSMKEYLSVSPFHCTCIRELWVMLRELTDYRQEHMGKNSFWITLDEILQQVLHIQQQPGTCSSEVEMDTDKFWLPPIFQCSNTTDFCWWLLHNMAPLYAYTSEGEHVSLTNPLQNNYMFLVQSLLKPLTSGEQQVDEAHLRCYMQTSLSLCKLWGPNIDVLIHLWDYFYKKLNHHFQIQGLGVEGLAKINKSAVSWLEKCKNLTKPDSRVDHMNSFQLFLKHLSSSLGEQGKNIIWKQLKGRFYSKFHPRRMQELTEIGLHNFTELFITLALIGDLEDVAGKMADFYAMLQMDNVHHGHRAVVWRGMFVLMLTYEEKGVDISFLAEKMAQEFNALCWEFSNDTLESSRRFQLWSFISMYLDCVQDVFEASDQLKLSEYKLLGRGLGQILSAVRENELRIVLNFLQLVLARHRIIYKRVSQQLSDQHQVTQQFREVADALWVTAYQFVQTHSCTLTPPPQLADVAASFTMLTLNLPPGPSTGIKEDFLSSFQYFGCNAAVSASVSCRYLNHMLPNQLVIERLSSDLKNYQPLVVQAWFKCALYLFKDNDQMQELSRLILKLPEVGELFEHVEMEASDSYSTVVVQFVVALGQSYHKTEGLMNKIKFREHATEYFGDITRHIGIILKNAGPPEALKAVYVIGGYMVKHCAQFLYVKSKPDCLLPSLLDSLVLPHVLFSASKTLNPSILQAIKDHLHLWRKRIQFIMRMRVHVTSIRITSWTADIEVTMRLWMTRFTTTFYLVNMCFVFPFMTLFIRNENLNEAANRGAERTCNEHVYPSGLQKDRRCKTDADADNADMFSRSDVLITGPPRSGTTIAGKIASYSENTKYLHEPMNPIERLVNCGNITAKPKVYKNADVNLVVDIKGWQRFYSEMFPRCRNGTDNRLILKDPIALKFSHSLQKRFSLLVVVKIRHPAALIASDCARRSDWRARYCHTKSIMRYLAQRKEQFQIIVILYKLYGNQTKFWYFTKHEDFCDNPLWEARRMLEFLRMRFTHSILHKVENITSIENPSKIKRYHDIHINSKAVRDTS
ncbi:protein MMS22-like [Lingula anatina]|uniref:Protein MMS22-like n=1 Tax=Lingula anatina TaxID=7574 RepID=A0A1S3I6N4_LINAN|nr:protein MMS22-like [Lingula anatina]|eukprot:XP_013393917.1 protein MMS22-like [Lingula anatina]